MTQLSSRMMLACASLSGNRQLMHKEATDIDERIAETGNLTDATSNEGLV